MKRAKGILDSLRLTKPFLLTRASNRFQVTEYSHLSPLLSSSLQKKPYNYDFLNTHQKLHFSSKPSSIVEVITTNEWSEDLEKELEISHPTLTHESVLYVLKKIDKNPQKALDFFNWVSQKHGFKPSFMVYSKMLRILGNKETMKEFWVLIEKMSDEGWDIDKETYLIILNNLKRAKMKTEATSWTEVFTKMSKESAKDASVIGVIDLVLGSDWNDDLKKKLGELNVSLSENVILRILRELRQVPLKALGFFRWVERHIGYTHNAVTYNSILRVLGLEESIEKFWSMVKELKSAGHDIDIDTYTKLSRKFQKNRMMKDAVELYELMMDSPFKPPEADCIFLLGHISLTATPDLDLVFRVVKKYEATGHTLSKAGYDEVHRSLVRVGKFDEAEKILDTMRKAGYEPDNITYSMVVFELCKGGRFEDAWKVLDEMEAQGCVPDIKTWTVLIEGHCNVGEIDQALKCFTKMLEKNVEADADLLEVLVNGLCSKGRVDSAYTMVIGIVDKANLIPLHPTYKHLIEKLLGERKLEEAMHLLRLMRKQQYPPLPEPFTDYISKFGTVDNATELFQTLTIRKYPSSSTYLRVLQSFFKEGRQSEARDLLYQCPYHIRNHSDILNLFASAKLRNTA